MEKCQLIFFLLVLVFSYLVTLDYFKFALQTKPFVYLKEVVTTPVASPRGPFDYFRLVQQWPPSICNSSGGRYCPQFFTIHGLWPDNFTGGHLNYCSTDRFIPITEANLLERLNTNWPDLIKGNNSVFWEQQWSKHGTCAYHYSQTACFTLALNLTNSYNLTQYLNQSRINPRADPYPAQNISNAIRNRTRGIPDLMCLVHTGRRRTLREIRICFNSSVANNNVIDCPPNHSSSSCFGNIYFPT